MRSHCLHVGCVLFWYAGITLGASLVVNPSYIKVTWNKHKYRYFMVFLGNKTATLIIMFLTFLDVTRGSHPIFQQTYDLWKNHQFHPNCGYHVPRTARNIPVFISSWLVFSTPLKNISQLGWLFPIYGKNVPNHQPARFKSVTWPCGLWFLKLAITYPDCICGSISNANRNKKETQSRKHSFRPSHVYIHSSIYPLVNKHRSYGKSCQVAVSLGTEIFK